MTDEAIRDGFAALKDNAQYQRLYQSALCRSEADWLVGINFTRRTYSKISCPSRPASVAQMISSLRLISCCTTAN